MKYFFLLFSVLICQVSLSQRSLEVGYDLNLNMNKPVVLPAKLVYSENVSYFHWNNTGGASESEMDAETMEIEIKIPDSLGTINITDYNKDSLYTRSRHFNEVLLLKEKNPELVWELSDETKKIGSFICKKASTNFRGRTYTAWYTPEVSLNIGPWKLNGLPGLIMEAYDHDKIVHFYFRSLKKPTGDILNYNSIIASGKEINLKEFEEIQDNLAQDLASRIRSKLPRGATMVVDHVEENYLEKEF